MRSTRQHLPFILPSQAQKHVTHNEALCQIDTLLHISVHSRTSLEPPALPVEGMQFLIPANPEGEWEGQGGKLASYLNGAWTYTQPKTGWRLWSEQDAVTCVYDGNTFIDSSHEEQGTSTNPSIFGINTTADTTNRLSVKSPNMLLSYDDTTSQSGDARLTINKSAGTDVASFIFQQGWDAKAELGIVGENLFSIRVKSSDGIWRDALKVDPETAYVSFPETNVTVSAPNLLGDAGRFAGSPDPQNVTIGGYQAPSYILPYNGAVLSAGPKFTHNNTTYGGGKGLLDPLVDSLMSTLRPANARRYGIEFYLMEITAGTGTASQSISLDGISHNLAIINPAAPILPNVTINYHIRVQSGSVCISSLGMLYINGVLTAHTVHRIAPSDGWVQVTQVLSFDANDFHGYESKLFGLYAQENSVLHIAAPTLVSGEFRIEPAERQGIWPSQSSWR